MCSLLIAIVGPAKPITHRIRDQHALLCIQGIGDDLHNDDVSQQDSAMRKLGKLVDTAWSAVGSVKSIQEVHAGHISDIRHLTWWTSSPTVMVQTLSLAEEGCLAAFTISATHNLPCTALHSATATACASALHCQAGVYLA